MDISALGKIFIFLGFVLIAFGVFLMFSNRLPYIGRLPGDIYIKKENFVFYFPLATSVIISVVLTLIFFLFGKRR